MILIYIITVIAFIDTFSQLPIIAPFSISLGATPMIVGLIIGMYSFSNILGNLLSGLWIDRIGPKKILAVGMLSVSVVIFLYAFVSTPNQLLLTRFAHGLVGGFIVPATFTLISSYSKTNTKGKKMAYSGAAVGIAAIVGPAFGAIISARGGYEWLFFSVSILMATFGILAIIFIKEKVANPEEEQKVEQDHIEPNVSILKTKPLLHAYLSIFLLLFSLGILSYGLPVMVEELTIRSEMTGVLLSIFGIVAILMFVLPTNRIYDKANKATLMSVGLTIVAVSLIILFLSMSLSTMIMAMVIFGLGFSLIFPSTSSTVIEYSKDEKRGIAFGIFYACFSFGVIAGSFIAGALPISTSQVFLLGGMILLLVKGLLLLVNKRN